MSQIKIYKIARKEQQEIIKTIIEILSGRKEIEFAFIHGSFLHVRLFRDIDLGIYTRGMKSSDYIDYELSLPQQIQDKLSLSYPIDVRVINGSPSTFIHGSVRGYGSSPRCGTIVSPTPSPVRSTPP